MRFPQIFWGVTFRQSEVEACYVWMVVIRVGQGPQTFFGTHGNQLPSLSGVHGFKDFVCSAHLLGSFNGQIYTYGSVLKSQFDHERIQEEGHYRKKS